MPQADKSCLNLVPCPCQVGTDGPENLLAYYEFDGTKDNGNMGVKTKDKLHHYDPHLKDFDASAGDPTWKGGKGKRIIGAHVCDCAHVCARACACVCVCGKRHA